MHMLYNSDSFAVVQFTLEPQAPVQSTPAGEAVPLRGGFEIVDKAARREIYIEGALAERFSQGVRALVDSGTESEEAFDDYIAGYAHLAQQPLVLH